MASGPASPSLSSSPAPPPLPFACVLRSCPDTQLTLLSTLGLTKVVINLIKNIPQLLLNYSRQSTVGWSIWGVWIDLAGATAAFIQQVLDVWNEEDWGPLVGNVPKFLLSVLSFAFDLAFILQHHVCYRGSNSEEVEGEGETGQGEEEGEGDSRGEEEGLEGDEPEWLEEEKEEAAKAMGKKRSGRQSPWAGNGEYLLSEGEQGSVNAGEGHSPPRVRSVR